MTGTGKSILLISPDAALSEAIKGALSGVTGVNMRTEVSTLAGLNGKASQLAVDKDLIIFETSSDEDGDIEAIRALSRSRRVGTKLLALADDGMTLARIRALNTAGVDEVLPSPTTGNGVANREISTRLHRLSRETGTALVVLPPHTGRIIAVAQARGGVGATTVAVNLAHELVGRAGFLKKKLPNSVALVDLDLQFGSVGAMLDLSEQDELHQLALDGTIPDAAFLARAMVKLPNGMSVLAAPSKFMPLDSLQPEQITALLDLLRRENDFVVVPAACAWRLDRARVKMRRRIVGGQRHIGAFDPAMPPVDRLFHRRQSGIASARRDQPRKATDLRFGFAERGPEGPESEVGALAAA